MKISLKFTPAPLGAVWQGYAFLLLHAGLFTLGITLLSSCNREKWNGENPLPSPVPVERILEALGGRANLERVQSIGLRSAGQAYEFGQAPEPVSGFVVDFTYALTTTIDATRFKQIWTTTSQYAFQANVHFSETVEGTKGKSDGVTGFIPDAFNIPGDPMFSTKLAARRKVIVMSSPLLMVHYLLQSNIKGATTTTLGVGYHRSSVGFGTTTPDLELVLDSKTGLPQKAQTIENDPLFGDVRYEVHYQAWQNVSGINYPTRLVHLLDGKRLREETLTEIVVNPPQAEGLPSVPDREAYPYNAEEARYGYLSSQFHFRTLMQTFPIDFPTTLVEAIQ